MTIKDILIEYNIPYIGAGDRHGREGWVSIDCPWCGPNSGKYHLGISTSSGASSCWKCGRHNTALVLATITGQKTGTMRAALDGATLVAPIMPKTGRLVPPKGITPMGPAHRAYLATRGFDADVVACLWGVQGLAQTARLAWRLYIPIYHHGEQVSWTTRTIKPQGTPRYISAAADHESIRHKEILYGADYAQNAIIIHEGPIDVWATGPGAVATCGTGYTEAQLKAMAHYPCRVVCFDNGVAAQRRARELADALSAYPGVTHNVQLETGDDPAEASPGEIAELRKTFLE